MPEPTVNNSNQFQIKELERQIALYITDLDKYRAIFNDAPLGIFRATIGGKYIEVNNTLTKLLGYENPTDLILSVKDISKQIYFNTKERKKLIGELLKGTSVLRHETLFKRKDGSIFPVTITLKMVFERTGKPLYMSGIVEDITVRIKAQESLISEKNQLRILIDNIPDYIYLKDSNDNFILVNKAFAALVNVKNPDDLNGKDSHQFSNAFVSNLLKDDKEIIQSGKPVLNKEEAGYETNQGKIVYAFTSKIPLKNNKGNIQGLIGIARNFTDLKLAQQQISASQSNLNAVLESTKNAIWSIDFDFKLITANIHFTHLFHSLFKKKIKVGDNFFSLLPDKQKRQWKKIHERVFKGEHLVFEEHYDLNEKKVYFEISVNPIVDSNQVITGITLFATNVTEKKLAGDALKESEARFRQLAENTNDVFILYDKQTILYANPAFERIYGRSVKELLRNSSILKESVHPEDKSKYLKYTKKLTGQKHSKSFQYRILKSNGQVKWLWTRNFPVLNEKSKVYRNISVISDITDQLELQSIISKSKNQQKGILDNIPYLAWLKDSEAKYILVNEPFAKVFDVDANDILGKSDFDIYPKEVAERYYSNDLEVMKNGKRQLFEEFENTASGNRWIEIFRTPIFNPEGKLIGITGISRDISGRKNMEEKLRQREEHYSALLQNSSDAISILDKSGIIIFENSPKNKISDFYIEELLGKSIFEVIHPDEIINFRKLFFELLQKPGRQIKREYRSLHKNKKWIYVESIFSNQLNNKAINGIIVNSRDISERKMSELKERVYHDNLIFLSNSALDLLGLSLKEDIYMYISDKLQLFLENALVVVSSFQEDKNIFQIETYSGPQGIMKSALQLLGKDIRGLSFRNNKKFSDLKNAGVVTNIKDNLDLIQIDGIERTEFDRTLEDLNVHKVYNISLARHNKLLGNITIFTLNKSIIKFKHIIETFVHQVSVSLHRSQLESELIKAKEKAEESDKLKTAFLTNMSHEIRTPMNGILGFAEMLNDDNISPANKKKYLEIIHSSGKMLINLIDDIIDFAKIEAGQINMSYQDFSLNGLLMQVHSSFLSEQFKKDKSKVELRVKNALTNDKSFIRTDPYRLRQILTNLVGNAFKFTDQGFIEFGYSKQKDTLTFYVKDTGIGIDSDKLKIIFDRFIQADNSSTRKYGGSGLGLAISKGFAEILGGKMWAESVLNEGSTFYFTIPFMPAVKMVEEEKSSHKPKKNYIWENRTFLVAEDDKFSYKFLESFLKQTKASVLHACDGKEAIEICRNNNKIDLILMDIQMPEMNGLQATEEIKRLNRFIPIIAQTANAIMEEKQKCYDAGCDDFITKPVNISELYTKIDKWLTLKK